VFEIEDEKINEEDKNNLDESYIELLFV